MSLPTKKSFLSDVAKHKMLIKHDNGLYRHIRFQAPGTSVQYFDLVTWPGSLSFSGDMGSFTFKRVEDMTQFFIGDVLGINPDYWSQKLESIDRTDGLASFDHHSFKNVINQDAEEQIAGLKESGELTEDQEQEIRKELEWLCSYENEHEAYQKTEEFDCHGVSFPDPWDWWNATHEYSDRYIWACWAIAWGVRWYRARKFEVLYGNGGAA